MNRMEVRNLRNKENKTGTEWALLNYYYILSMISEVCIDEGKRHILSEDAIEKIRNHLRDNWI